MDENETVAFKAGFEDRTFGRGHLGLQLLGMADISDGELSDYWYGWHQGGRVLEAAAPRKRRAKR